MSTSDRIRRLSLTPPKYKILNDEARVFHTERGDFTGYRIYALRDFSSPGYGSVKKGTWGGFVSSNKNLATKVAAGLAPMQQFLEEAWFLKMPGSWETRLCAVLCSFMVTY